MTDQVNELEDALTELRSATALPVESDGGGSDEYNDGYKEGYSDALTAVKRELGEAK